MKLKILFIIFIFTCLPLMAQNTWVEQNSGISTTLYSVHFADSLHGCAVGALGVIVTTDDGGENWQLQDSRTSSTLWGNFMLNQNICWAVGAGGTIMKSVNGGQN